MKQDSFAANRELIQVLEKRSKPISCSTGFVLFNQGEAASGLYIIQSGEAALIMESPAGDALMCLHSGAGSLLGLPRIIGNEPYTMTAMARKGSEVRFVSRNDFEDLIRAEPSLYSNVLQVLAAEVHATRRAHSEFEG